MKQAGIYVNDVFCGILTEDEEGYHFCYEKDYLASQGAVPISPTMPLTEQQYDKEMMFPVFDGLIPEGWLLGYRIHILENRPSRQDVTLDGLLQRLHRKH